jgi:predicted signal transduction protein with EAL and GGDEF domain
LRQDDLVGRLSGDEFILVTRVAGGDAAAELARRVIGAIREPVRVAGVELSHSASIGICMADAGEPPSAVIENADMAMYRAKSLGRGRFALFEPAMRQQARERLALEESLRLAGGDGQFGCFLQPIVQLEERKLVGFEALARWQHPQRGLLEPASFIDAAEDCGLIQEIDLQVMGMACAALGRWQRQPGWGGLRLSVNVSARTLGASDLVERIEPILGRSGIDPAQLYLEITETSLVEDIQSTAITIAGLQRLNLQLAIDDFGTGYSSLLYLKRFPVGLLKIDRSFVADLGPSPRDGEDEAIARAIISLAAGLGVKVVAEGVETPEQEARLLEFGCDFGQGYLYGRPLPIQEAGRQWFDE